MDFKLIIVAVIMMLPICLIRVIPALNIFGVGKLVFGLSFCVGMCVLCAGVSKFTNIEQGSMEERPDGPPEEPEEEEEEEKED